MNIDDSSTHHADPFANSQDESFSFETTNSGNTTLLKISPESESIDILSSTFGEQNLIENTFQSLAITENPQQNIQQFSNLIDDITVRLQSVEQWQYHTFNTPPNLEEINTQFKSLKETTELQSKVIRDQDKKLSAISTSIRNLEKIISKNLVGNNNKSSKPKSSKYNDDETAPSSDHVIIIDDVGGDNEKTEHQDQTTKH